MEMNSLPPKKGSTPWLSLNADHILMKITESGWTRAVQSLEEKPGGEAAPSDWNMEPASQALPSTNASFSSPFEDQPQKLIPLPCSSETLDPIERFLCLQDTWLPRTILVFDMLQNQKCGKQSLEGKMW